MSITSLFNETELEIFSRQTGFTFGDYLQSADGTLLAIDRDSMQLFVGRELLRTNIHGLRSIVAASVGEDGVVQVTLADGSEVNFLPEAGQAEPIVAELSEFTLREAPVEQEEAANEEIPQESNDDIAEVYSRLLNTGRSSAIGYLVSDTGMSVKDAMEYVDRIEKAEGLQSEAGEDARVQDILFDGSMSHTAVLAVVKALKPGDRVHIEYKPLIGKLRVYDAEFSSLEIDIMSGKYFSLHISALDYDSILESVTDELFDYMNICVSLPENGFETTCHLKRVKVLERI